MLRDELGEALTSLRKVHFTGIRVFGDEFEHLMQANNSLFRRVHEVVKNSKESDHED